MRDLLSAIDRWRASGEGVALATVTRIWGSAPRPLGAKMAVSSAGAIAGSVSGGCVEGAVAEAAAEVLATGTPRQLRFGVSDETAWSVGLTCGGELEVFVEALPPPGDPASPAPFDLLRQAVAAGRLVARAVVVGGEPLGFQQLFAPGRQPTSAEGPGWSPPTLEAIDRAFASLEAQRVGGDDGREVFVDVLPPPLKLIAVGAVHVAIPLVELAQRLGFHTTVVDPRPGFANRERFPSADELLVEWPEEALERLGLDQGSYLAVLSHRLDIDLPALRAALRRPVRYIGALGSKRTHAKRVAVLSSEGFDDSEIGRIHAPIGLDLGGRGAEEIALAVLAQMVAVRHGRTPGPGGG